MECPVLVVEDDAIVSGLLQISLERYGYHALMASDIDTATVTLRQMHADLRCLITDGMGPKSEPGLALAALAHALNPSLPIVFISGNPRQENHCLLGNERFVQKPFKVEELLEAIHGLGAAAQTTCVQAEAIENPAA